MWQAGGAEDQGHAERNILDQGLVDAPDRRLAVRIEDAGAGERELGDRVLDRVDLVEEGQEVEVDFEVVAE